MHFPAMQNRAEVVQTMDLGEKMQISSTCGELGLSDGVGERLSQQEMDSKKGTTTAPGETLLSSLS